MDPSMLRSRVPLAVEAVVEALADTVEAHRWAWGGDSALATHGLLVWRDHDAAVTLHAPTDTYDPQALVWALGRQMRAAPAVAELANASLAHARLGSGHVAVTLERLPLVACSRLWAATTTVARMLPDGTPQRVLSRDATIDLALQRWLTDDHSLAATIDALTIADQEPAARLPSRCERLVPGRSREVIAARLTCLQATPEVRLRLHLRPDQQAQLRAAADKLHTVVRARGAAR